MSNEDTKDSTWASFALASVQKPVIYVYSYIEDKTVALHCYDSADHCSTRATRIPIRRSKYQWVARATGGSTMPDRSDRSELKSLTIYSGQAEEDQKNLRLLTRTEPDAARDVWSDLVRDAFQKKMGSMGHADDWDVVALPKPGTKVEEEACASLIRSAQRGDDQRVLSADVVKNDPC